MHMDTDEKAVDMRGNVDMEMRVSYDDILQDAELAALMNGVGSPPKEGSDPRIRLTPSSPAPRPPVFAAIAQMPQHGYSNEMQVFNEWVRYDHVVREARMKVAPGPMGPADLMNSGNQRHQDQYVQMEEQTRCEAFQQAYSSQQFEEYVAVVDRIVANLMSKMNMMTSIASGEHLTTYLSTMNNHAQMAVQLVNLQQRRALEVSSEFRPPDTNQDRPASSSEHDLDSVHSYNGLSESGFPVAGGLVQGGLEARVLMDEEGKRQNRRKRNKEAQRACREKKKAQSEIMDEKLERLQQSNTSLLTENAALLAENKSLKDQIKFLQSMLQHRPPSS